MSLSSNVWFVKDGKLGIGVYSSSTGKITTLDVTDKTLRVHHHKRPDKFTSSDLTKKISDLGENTIFPDSLAYGVVCKVMQRCAEIKANPQMAQYYKGEYMDYVVRAKKYSNKGRVGASYEIRGADY